MHQTFSGLVFRKLCMQSMCESVSVCVSCMPAKLKPHNRWTVWINKCVHDMTLSLLLSLSLFPTLHLRLSPSLYPWLHEGQVMSRLWFQKPFVWLGRRTDPIMSEGQEVKTSWVASCFSFREMAMQWMQQRETLKPEEIILQVNIVPFCF